MNPTDKGRILAEALPYLRAFHGKTIVVRFGEDAAFVGFVHSDANAMWSTATIEQRATPVGTSSRWHGRCVDRA